MMLEIRGKYNTFHHSTKRQVILMLTMKTLPASLYQVGYNFWGWGGAVLKLQATQYSPFCFSDHINYRGWKNLIFLPVDLTVGPQLLLPTLKSVGHLKASRKTECMTKIAPCRLNRISPGTSPSHQEWLVYCGILIPICRNSVYWVEAETLNVQKSHAGWSGIGVLFYGERNWVGWVEKNLSQHICKSHQTCYKPLL